MRKILGCFMAFIMIIGLLPGLSVTVNAADSVVSYDIWVGEEEVTSKNLSGTGWTYEPESATLTLNDYSYLGDGYSSAGIYSKNALKIELIGINSVTCNSNSSGWACGIRVIGTINSVGTLTISGNGTLNVTGGTGYTSHGLSAENIIIENGTVNATGREASGSSGIYAAGTFTVNGGKVTATASTSSAGTSRGIECNNFILNNGEVTAIAGEATGSSYGIQAKKTMSHNMERLSAKGETCAYIVSGTKYGQASTFLTESKDGSLSAANFIFTKPDCTYNGQAKPAVVKPKTGIDCGKITVKYYIVNADGTVEDNPCDSVPAQLGTYKVKIDVAQNDKYNLATDLTDDSWTYTIDYGFGLENMYEVTGVGDSCWIGSKNTTNKVIIKSSEGYQIGKTTDDLVNDEIDFSFEDTDKSIKCSFYLKDKENGAIYFVEKYYDIDLQAPVIRRAGEDESLSDGKYCEKLEFTVKDDNLAYVAEDTVDGPDYFDIEEEKHVLGAGTHTIIAQDKAGNVTKVTVTVVSDHQYEIKYEWKDDFTACIATKICENCNDKIEEVVKTDTRITQYQSCTEPEQITYTAVFTKEGFEEQKKILETKPALGHILSEDDGDCTTPVTCARCDVIMVPAKEHDFNGTMKFDESGHWKECLNDGCIQIEKSAHNPNIAAATENEDQVCKDCGYVLEAKSGHIHKLHLEYVKENPSTCTKSGNKAYYRCIDDNQCFLDENAEKSIPESVLVIPAMGHKAGDWIIDKEASVTEAGIRHKECTVCKEVLKTEEIEKLQPVLYKVLEGADGTYTINADLSYTLRIEGELSKFVNIELDGTVIDGKYYNTKSGSTVITFTKEYLESLSTGKHIVNVNYTDGLAKTTLIITKKEEKQDEIKESQPELPNGEPEITTSPQTGDSNRVIVWLAILLVSGSALLGWNKVKTGRGAK